MHQRRFRRTRFVAVSALLAMVASLAALVASTSSASAAPATIVVSGDPVAANPAGRWVWGGADYDELQALLVSEDFGDATFSIDADGMDPTELEFPFEEASGFEDLETNEQIPVIPGKLRAEYRRMVDAHLDALRTKFTGNRIDYTLLDTSKPLDLALFQYLLARERLSKTR